MIMRFRFLLLTVCMLGAASQVFFNFKPAVAATQLIPTAPSFKPAGALNSANAEVVNDKNPVKATAAGWVKLANGQTAAVVRFEIANGWHMYWKNPGESGAPPLAQLRAKDGWTLSEPIFPRPSIIKTVDDTEFIYDTSWEWLLPIQGSAGATAPACSFDLSWMTCKDHCEIGRARVEFAAATGEIPAAGDARLGRSLPTTGATATFNSKDQTIAISGSTSSAASKSIAVTTAQFIPDVMPGVSLKSAGPFQAAVSEGKISLNIPIEIQPHNALGKPIVFKGLLLYGQSNNDRCEIIHLPLDSQVSQP
jgi:DsbC/DsbD-like thiol-disulfide interchange protein